MHLRLLLKNMRRAAAELLYPPFCPICGRVTAYEDFCPDCRAFCISEPVCPRCGLPRKHCDSGPNCKARRTPSVFRFAAPFLYEGCVKDAIAAFKFENTPQHAAPFARRMAETAAREYAGITFGAVTYVPLHPKRRKQRGYDQAELIARRLGEYMSLPVCAMLKKVRDNPAQHTLGARLRAENAADAYEPSMRPEGRILLADDVITTGSTMEACAAALLRAGASEVYGIGCALAFAGATETVGGKKGCKYSETALKQTKR